MTNIGLSFKCAITCLAVFSPVYAVSFNSLGPVDIVASMPSSVFAPVVVSGDGSTVAATDRGHGFTWTSTSGRVSLAGFYDSFPTGLSYDGSTVVGGSLENDAWRPAYWRNGTKTQIYVEGSGYAGAVSADGQTIVGTGSRAFKWNNGTVWLAGDRMWSARGISADGTVVTGLMFVSGKMAQAAIWKNGVVTSLGSISADPAEFSYANGVSPDGNVVFGHVKSTTIYTEPFRWTAAEGMVGLGAAPGQRYPSDMDMARASNYDGSVLVGSAGLKAGDRATIWDVQHGVRFLDEVLTAEYGIDLTGWSLRVATGMSWDGKTIGGYGINPQGVREGWVVNIPEPASLLLLALGFTIGLTRSTHRQAGD